MIVRAGGDDKNIVEKAVEKVTDTVGGSNRSKPGEPGNVSMNTNAGPHANPAYGSQGDGSKRAEDKKAYKAAEKEEDNTTRQAKI